MSSLPVITSRSLGKTYRIWDRPSSRIVSPVQEWFASLLPGESQTAARLRSRAGSHYRDFHALSDVSFEIRRGESFGIIGRNGSGKSTLLQILAGTLRASSGEFTVRGRVAALLELGSGFNPEFTGVENVILNGSILGLSRAEMHTRLPRVAAFADIGDFIHQPVKTYSSGMMVRLAFAVQTIVDPDILIIDEALAVGDVFFQQKCFKRLEELRARGTVVILVSHAMGIVEQYCDRALLLDHGRVRALGPSPEVIKQYYLIHREVNAPPAGAHVRETNDSSTVERIETRDEGWPGEDAFFDLSNVRQIADGKARCLALGLTDEQGRPSRFFQQGEVAHFYYAFEILEDIETPVVGIVLFNARNIIVHGKNTLEYGCTMPARVHAGTVLRFRHTVKLDLEITHYTIETGIASISAADLRNAGEMHHNDLTACVVRHCHLTGIGPFEIGFRLRGSPVQLLHHGIANLPGDVELLRSAT
ncbi:ABC transporter ATP-binding protein [Congregicoccus parvus]|uniref:ABC transporter ATP-binding protein n=1 Tax=Congregicoccus parvus TaxID=3081749 RepID=UPI003FA57DE3